MQAYAIGGNAFKQWLCDAKVTFDASHDVLFHTINKRSAKLRGEEDKHNSQARARATRRDARDARDARA